AQVRRFRAVTRNLHSVELQNRAMSRASTRLRFIEPQLPTLVDQPPEGADWIHEIKHDGYRTMLVLERGKACAYTRNGHDWSDRYSGIIRAARTPVEQQSLMACATISWWNAERSCKLFSVATLKVRFNSAKSLSGMPQPSSAPVRRMSWNASSPNSQPLATAAVEARPGSRPSVLPKANSSCLASTISLARLLRQATGRKMKR